MKNPIIMQINYAELPGGNFGKRTLEDVCRFAAETGFDGIEFRGKIPACLGEISFLEYAKRIADAKERCGLSEILFGLDVGGAANRDVSEREKSIAIAVERAKIAREICGSNVCNTSGTPVFSADKSLPWNQYDAHGSAAASEEDWMLTVDAYQKIGAAIEGSGLRLAFETHMNYLHDLPAAARRLVDLIDSPAIGINLDYGNTVYFPKRPTLEEAIDICGEKLFYTHLKNSLGLPDGKRLPTALGEGEINHRLYFEKLVEVGYVCPIGVEAPRPGDRTHYARCDMAYVKELLSDMA